MSIRKVAFELSIPYPTIRNRVKLPDKLNAFKKSTNLPGAGRPTIIPQPEQLLTFMDARRHQERALTCAHMVNFLKQYQQPWLQEYIARQKAGCGYDKLLKLLQKFCRRHGYTHQQASMSKRVISDLESTEFAARFYGEHGDVPDHCVYNVDETGIQYDMPSRYIWSRRGGSPKLSKGEKHSYRTTAVLTIRRDGLKLPILFVIKANRQYLWFVLAERVTGKSVLVLDNFESHVCDEGKETASLLGYDVCALPPNATSHCQPLDVSFMAPFKRHMRDLWIAEDMVSDNSEGNDDDWMSPAAHLKRRVMIDRAINAWEKITPEQVRGRFLKAIPKP
ncbi:hypothetical protein DYB32_008918 [Aphanomyces invadans]|uniref:DDE-1 domain-containing protein n=1 Tax=Aphanomyces invadans TaxID=157072 RepID=A0A418AJU6_9STRA|nr:hypothetical protein DYB32_008918 [Aphanomyces invadans]